jgi:hypothetical protein
MGEEKNRKYFLNMEFALIIQEKKEIWQFVW